MNIINRTLAKNPSPTNSQKSSCSIELTEQEYVPKRKDSFDVDSNNVNSDERPLLSPRSNFLQKIKNCYYDNKIVVINKMLSISIHITIMIIFEIYFYFNYVIYLEKNEFMGKIHSYLNELQNIPLTLQKRLVVSKLIFDNSQEILLNLYKDYVSSIMEQDLLKQKLLMVAYKMAGISGGVFCFFLLLGILNWREINWKKIIIDNILMFSFLGLFEYFFFIKVILHYTPVTDGEIKYTIYKGLINYFNQTGS